MNATAQNSSEDGTGYGIVDLESALENHDICRIIRCSKAQIDYIHIIIYSPFYSLYYPADWSNIVFI